MDLTKGWLVPVLFSCLCVPWRPAQRCRFYQHKAKRWQSLWIDKMKLDLWVREAPHAPLSKRTLRLWPRIRYFISCLCVEHLVFIIKILFGGYDACFLGQILNPFSFETAVLVVTSLPINVVFARLLQLCISKELLKETVASSPFLSLLLILHFLFFPLPLSLFFPFCNQHYFY